MPQHQIDSWIAGGEVLGIGLGLGMMQVEKHVGKNRSSDSPVPPGLRTQPLQPCMLLIGGAPLPASAATASDR